MLLGTVAQNKLQIKKENFHSQFEYLYINGILPKYRRHYRKGCNYRLVFSSTIPTDLTVMANQEKNYSEPRPK